MTKQKNQKNSSLAKVVITGIVAICLGVVIGIYFPKPKALTINEIASTVADSPSELIGTTVFDTDKSISEAGWKLIGYKGDIPYTNKGLMVIPDPITSGTSLWTNQLNIPVANFSGTGMIVEISLVSSGSDVSNDSPFTMVAGLSSDIYLNSSAFAVSETPAVISSDLKTYRFLFTANQFAGVDVIKSINIGLNPTAADIQAMAVKEISVKIIK